MKNQPAVLSSQGEEQKQISSTKLEDELDPQAQIELDKEKKEAREWIKKNIDTDLRQKYMQKLGITKKSFSFLSPPIEDKPEEQEIQKQLDEKLKVDKLFEQGEYQITFFSRSDDDVRKSYIKKLQSQNILKNNQAQKHQSLVIFDWDDTILCTNYLSQYNFVDLPTEVLRQLSNLDNSASKLLRKALNYGNTYIVTNAAKGWVEYSSKLFLPRVNAVIQENVITVISARSEYEDIFPGDCYKWKIEAFKDLKKNYDEDLITNLICLGDSNIEIEAAHILAQGFNQSLIKTIKFRENPKPDELTKQQDLVADKFEQIYVGVRNLTIRLERRNNQSPNIY
ncbi:kinase, putative (macronuclear) [Tetrahymena thermophila SB210]|uniref:Kinase, putative n=1 Tax=Tetrahymena thermophila (strain SB210) TaxID=312017 RepID=Q23JM6_TETTS|nr:kinase, putative [Tetrahymena thermophila SB210]EAR96717.2 kinase, putative [Tetrahymena thermophila SB210]|eukprot:XP_001016962.2 kinase, putative [Tetrahymena thermophila SB210]